MDPVSETISLVKQYLKSGSYVIAGQLCGKILAENPNHAEALHLMSITSYHKGQHVLASELIHKAVFSDPHNPEYYYNLGIILAALGHMEKAVTAYQNAINLQPGYSEAINNLGLMLYDQDKLEESIVLFQQAICAKPDFTNAWYNLGMALHAHGRPEEAIDAYNQVLKLIPDSAATRFNRSISLLLTENFEEGWDEYEWRFRSSGKKTDGLPGKSLRRWDGASLNRKRILVNDEQGIGDTLQFIRYLPMLKERGGTVMFETSKPLKGLLEKFSGLDELVEPSPVGMSKIEFDLYVPLMSLPGIFKTTLKTIPDRIPYIFPSKKKIELWQDRINKHTFNVGIVWAGNPTVNYQQAGLSGLEHVDLAWAGNPSNKIATRRSNRLECFAPIAGIEGVQLYGLQKGAAAEQVKELSNLISVINLGEDFDDFSDTAGVIAGLDLIISVDTSVAHLAGAMGKPVWVLIPYVPDWRWMLDREDSPWYPSMRLFRQQKRGDWGAVFHQIAHELHLLVHQ
jgi:tetratricopeptide (TPR) repeat protein